MKLTKIFMAALAVAGLASCQQDPGDLGKEQKNPQEAVFEASAIKMTLADEIQNVDLNDKYMQNNSTLPEQLMVHAINVEMDENVPEGAKFDYTLQIASLPDYSDAESYELENNSLPYYELQKIFNSYFSESVQDARTLYVRVAVYMTVGNEFAKVGGPNYYFLQGSTITVSPVKIPMMAFNTPGSNGTNSMQLMGRVDKESGLHQIAGFLYLTGAFTIEDLSSNFKLGMDADGNLSTTSTAPIAMPAAGAGMYYVACQEVTESNYTLTITRIDSVGCIGDFNSWGGDAALTSNAEGTVWTGDVDFTSAGGWKFRMNGGWDINLGGDSMRVLTPFNGPNLILDNAGVYTVTLDLSTLPYHCTVVAK